MLNHCTTYSQLSLFQDTPEKLVYGLTTDGYKVDEVFDPANELRLKVTKATDTTADPRPRIGDICDVFGGPAEFAANSGLPVGAHRNLWPCGEPEPCGFHGLPNIDVGVADDEHVAAVRAARDRLSQPCLLAAPNEVVKEHAGAPVGARPKLVEHGSEVVCPVELFDNDPFGPKVCAPHLFDEFSIVTPLNKDAARHGDPGSGLGCCERARGGALARSMRRFRRDKLCGLAVDEKPVRERKPAHRAIEIAKLEHAVTRVDDLTEKLGDAVFYDEAACERNLFSRDRAAAGLLAGNRIIVVTVIKHDHSLAGHLSLAGHPGGRAEDASEASPAVNGTDDENRW